MLRPTEEKQLVTGDAHGGNYETRALLSRLADDDGQKSEKMQNRQLVLSVHRKHRPLR
jgi:hypothetical protein